MKKPSLRMVVVLTLVAVLSASVRLCLAAAKPPATPPDLTKGGEKDDKHDWSLMEINQWGKRHRISECLKILQTYGSAAKPLIPRLRELENELQNHWEARGLHPQIDLVRQPIAAIEADDNPPVLRQITRRDDSQ